MHAVPGSRATELMPRATGSGLSLAIRAPLTRRGGSAVAVQMELTRIIINENSDSAYHLPEGG